MKMVHLLNCRQQTYWKVLLLILPGSLLNYPCNAQVLGQATQPRQLLVPRDSQPMYRDYHQRAASIIRYFATHKPTGFPRNIRRYARSGIYYAMARYSVGDIQAANSLADQIFSSNLQVLGNDQSFIVMTGMDLYLRYKQHMPSQLRWKIRLFVTQQPEFSTRPTANHRLMLATGQYLATQAWPDWDQTHQVHQKSKAVISQFVVNLGREGMIEHDSPVYHVFYLNSLLSLQDHVTDPQFRNQAQVGLELLLASMAPKWLNGYWATSTLRTFAFTHDPHQAAQIGPVGWLYWGGQKPPMWLGAAVMHAVSDYRVPEVLVKISRDRTQPYIHRETQGANFNGQAKYRKYTYMDRQYALFSQYDGRGKLAWNEQMQRMGLVWDAPASGASLVIKQPVKGIRGDTKRGQVLQHKRALIGVYKGPVTAFIPNNSTVIHQFEKSGWIFMHGSSVLIGLQLTNGHQRQRSQIIGFGKRYRATFDRLVSPTGKNGVILQTAPVEDFQQSTARATLQAFAKTVLSQAKIDQRGLNQVNPTLKYTDLEGNQLALTFNRDRTVNNQPINYLAWPLFDNPWMKSNPQFCLRIQYGNTIREYSCKDWTIRERSR